MDKKLKLVVWASLVFMISVVLSCTIFETGFLGSKSSAEIRIEAAAEKNSESWGTDVRIADIKVNDQIVPFEELEYDTGWNLERSVLVALNPEVPVSISWNAENIKNLKIEFYTQIGSGIADIYIDDVKVDSLDLYSEDWILQTYEIYLGEVSVLSHLFLFALIYLLVSEILYLLIKFAKDIIKNKNFPRGVLLFVFSLIAVIWFTYDCSMWDRKMGGQFDSYFSMEIWYFVHVFFLIQGNMLTSCFFQEEKTDHGKFGLLFRKSICIAGWGVYVLTGIELLNNSQGFYNLTAPSYLWTLFLLWIACYMICGILKNIFWSGCVVSILIGSLAVVNYYTLMFRGTVFLPADILAAGTAVNVLSQYTLRIGVEILMSAGLVMCGCNLLRFFETGKVREKKRYRLMRTVVPLLIGGIFFYEINTTSVQNFFHFAVNTWISTVQCEEEGFALTFFVNVSNTFPHKPKGYSKKKVAELYSEYQTEKIPEEVVRPNILVIMNESFSDLEEFALFSASEALTPFLDSQTGKDNTLSGYVQVPVFGGGTSKTEFEFLTGVNSRDYPTSSPYDTFVAKPIPALPESMESLGYESVALHPSIATNWSRDKGYPKLGFDKFIDSGQMEYTDLVRDFISDESFYNEIIKIDEETDEPLFLFGITMQNHGGYDDEKYEEPVQIVSPSGDFPLATQYINLVRESDRALEKFVSYYETVEDPTVILFFGDHLPNVEDELLESITEPYMTETDKDNLLIYHTPYYIWTNCEMDKENLPEDGEMLSISLLQSVVMDVAKLPKTGYQKFLSEVRNRYPVISPGCILNADGSVVENGNISWLTDYADLQYDLLKGKAEEKESFYCHPSGEQR